MVVSWEASSSTRDRLLAIVFGIHIIIIVVLVLLTSAPSVNHSSQSFSLAPAVIERFVFICHLWDFFPLENLRKQRGVRPGTVKKAEFVSGTIRRIVGGIGRKSYPSVRVPTARSPFYGDVAKKQKKESLAHSRYDCVLVFAHGQDGAES